MRVFCIIILISISLEGVSQNFFMGLNVGYGAGIAPVEIADGNIHEIAQSTFKYTTVKHSYGHGINFNAHIGYKVNGFLHCGAILSYLDGIEVRKVVVNSSSTKVDERYGTMLRITPNIKVNFTRKKVSIYNRFGAVIGLNGKIIRERTFESSTLNTYQKVKFHDSGVSIGFMAGTGVELELMERLYLNTELQLYVQSFAPRKSEVVEYLENGENKLSELTIRQRHSAYVDEFIVEPGQLGIVDSNSPSINLKRYYPFNSIGLNIGLIFYFNKKEIASQH